MNLERAKDMAKAEKLEKIGERAKLAANVKELNRLSEHRAQLNLKIDADLKDALQKAYGRNLTALFEEMAVDRLRRDGHLPPTTIKKAE